MKTFLLALLCWGSVFAAEVEPVPAPEVAPIEAPVQIVVPESLIGTWHEVAKYNSLETPNEGFTPHPEPILLFRIGGVLDVERPDGTKTTFDFAIREQMNADIMRLIFAFSDAPDTVYMAFFSDGQRLITLLTLDRETQETRNAAIVYPLAPGEEMPKP